MEAEKRRACSKITRKDEGGNDRIAGGVRRTFMSAARRIVVAAALVALVGAGCSGGPSGRGATVKPSSHAVDPYKASLAFARCMRRHGVPHPNPDRAGNFHLTPHDEQLMRRAGPKKHEQAEEACFHYLEGTVSTKPLSRHAKALAAKALTEFSRCMGERGYAFFSDPVVRNMSRGRAFFGFKKTDPRVMKARRTERYKRAQQACEKSLNAKLDKIIADDRGENA
jgi:hypothetical protein